MSLLLAPWTRLSLLVVLLVAAGVCVLLFEPQRLLSEGWPPGLPVGTAVLLFAAAYGVCAAAFVPRPLLNLAAGAVFGTQFGLVAAVGGTVLGAGIAFGLGRIMGQEALRPYLRGRWLEAADGQLEAGTASARCSPSGSFPVCPSWWPTTARRCPAAAGSPSSSRRRSASCRTPPRT